MVSFFGTAAGGDTPEQYQVPKPERPEGPLLTAHKIHARGQEVRNRINRSDTGGDPFMLSEMTEAAIAAHSTRPKGRLGDPDEGRKHVPIKAKRAKKKVVIPTFGKK